MEEKKSVELWKYCLKRMDYLFVGKKPSAYQLAQLKKCIYDWLEENNISYTEPKVNLLAEKLDEKYNIIQYGNDEIYNLDIDDLLSHTDCVEISEKISGLSPEKQKQQIRVLVKKMGKKLKVLDEPVYMETDTNGTEDITVESAMEYILDLV